MINKEENNHWDLIFDHYIKMAHKNQLFMHIFFGIRMILYLKISLQEISILPLLLFLIYFLQWIKRIFCISEDKESNQKVILKSPKYEN